MSKIKFGNISTVRVHLVGLTIHPEKERTLTLHFSTKNEDYQCFVNVTQSNLISIDHCLKNRPDPCPDYLVLDILPDLFAEGNDDEIASKIGFDADDQQLMSDLFKYAPSLLCETWLSQEDAYKLIDFQNHKIEEHLNKEEEI